MSVWERFMAKVGSNKVIWNANESLLQFNARRYLARLLFKLSK
jgi:hypothetical protein